MTSTQIKEISTFAKSSFSKSWKEVQSIFADFKSKIKESLVSMKSRKKATNEIRTAYKHMSIVFFVVFFLFCMEHETVLWTDIYAALKTVISEMELRTVLANVANVCAILINGFFATMKNLLANSLYCYLLIGSLFCVLMIEFKRLRVAYHSLLHDKKESKLKKA